MRDKEPRPEVFVCEHRWRQIPGSAYERCEYCGARRVRKTTYYDLLRTYNANEMAVDRVRMLSSRSLYFNTSDGTVFDDFVTAVDHEKEWLRLPADGRKLFY